MYRKIKIIIFIFSIVFTNCNEDSPTSFTSYNISNKYVDEVTQEFTINNVKFLLKYVQGGTFYMGAQKDDPNGINYDTNIYSNEILHKVTLTKDYWIGETEVTQELWHTVMGDNPSYFKGDLQRPVEQVSFVDAIMFCNKLSLLLGKEPVYSLRGYTDPDKWLDELQRWKDMGGTADFFWRSFVVDFYAAGFRLPTEAEWEYAARGGMYSKGTLFAGSNDLNEVAVNNTVKTEAVKSKKHNELGLYDMTGNVWEWCNDIPIIYDANKHYIDPRNESMSWHIILRSGCWMSSVRAQRVTYRLCEEHPYFKWRANYGLRIVFSQYRD